MAESEFPHHHKSSAGSAIHTAKAVLSFLNIASDASPSGTEKPPSAASFSISTFSEGPSPSPRLPPSPHRVVSVLHPFPTHTGPHGFHSQEEIPEQPQGFLCQTLNSILPADRLPDLGKLPWSWQPSMGIAPFQPGFCPAGPQSSVRSSNVLQNFVFPCLAFAFVLPATISRWFSVGTLRIICAQMRIHSTYNLCPQDAEFLMPSDPGGLNSHTQKGRQRLCSGDRIMAF